LRRRRREPAACALLHLPETRRCAEFAAPRTPAVRLLELCSNGSLARPRLLIHDQHADSAKDDISEVSPDWVARLIDMSSVYSCANNHVGVVHAVHTLRLCTKHPARSLVRSAPEDNQSTYVYLSDRFKCDYNYGRAVPETADPLCHYSRTDLAHRLVRRCGM
jgi:hypothetical protein